MNAAPLLQVDGLRMHFFTKVGVVKAVDDVSFSVGRGDRWEFTLILPQGWGHEWDVPPGDNYHRWGWQEVEDGEDRPAEIPADVAERLKQWAEDPMHGAGEKYTYRGWTIKAWEDDSDA